MGMIFYTVYYLSQKKLKVPNMHHSPTLTHLAQRSYVHSWYLKADCVCWIIFFLKLMLNYMISELVIQDFQRQLRWLGLPFLVTFSVSYQNKGDMNKSKSDYSWVNSIASNWTYLLRSQVRVAVKTSKMFAE